MNEIYRYAIDKFQILPINDSYNLKNFVCMFCYCIKIMSFYFYFLCST